MRAAAAAPLRCLAYLPACWRREGLLLTPLEPWPNPLPSIPPLPPHTHTACAAIDTFECAGTFARKTGKFSAAPEDLPIPADLADAAPSGSKAAAAAKGARSAGLDACLQLGCS